MEGIFRRSVEKIHRNAERVRRGLVNYIPFNLPRLEEWIPGIQKKNYTIITANSGVGKSKITKALYVINPVDYVIAHQETGIKLKIFYFCLEESKLAFMDSIICNKLHEFYGVRIPIKPLNSIGPIVLSEEHEELLGQPEMVEYFRKFEEIVEIIDDIKHPYFMYEHVERYMEAHGHWTKKTVPYYDKATKTHKDAEVNDYYVPDDPELYVEVITDHLAKMYLPKGMDLHQAMGEYSSRYCCDLRDKYFCTIVNVVQQVADQEKKQFTNQGQSIEAKLEPSLDGLGDNKTVQRDADEIIGVFAPARHDILEHRKYDIRQFQDSYRSLKGLKMRDGDPNARIGLFFDGAVNVVEELPPVEQMTSERYQSYLARVGRSGAPVTQGTFDFSRVPGERRTR